VTGPDPTRVATVFQDPGLFPWRTTLENVEFGLELQGVTRERRRAVATELLGPLGLRDFGAKYPRELSGGMRQRVAIGRALAIDTPIVLMDEPFGALDAQTRLIIQEEFLKIWERQRKTVLFVTHDLQEAIALSDRVVLISARPGRIKATYQVDLPRPRHIESVLAHPRFMALFQEIWASLKQEVLAARERPA